MRKLILVAVVIGSSSSCNCGKATVVETKGVFKLGTPSLDFGPVTEFTSKTLSVEVENTGRSPLTVHASLTSATSPDFTLGEFVSEVPPGAVLKIPITFNPMGAGSDTGTLALESDDHDTPTASVPISGGPIHPALAFEPDPLVFAPVNAPLVTRSAIVRSVGGSTLHITAVGVSASGNPDFAITPPSLPISLAPDASTSVQVQYARSLNAAEGRLEVVSDDADAGVRALRLLPDPARVCGDRVDNDTDGLTDWPDDPGCTSADDDDEYNPPECVNGGMQPCGSSMGICRPGVRFCANSVWGSCDGGVRPALESCNGLDDDCNGMSDENVSELCSINGCNGARACVPNSGVDGGQFTSCIPVSSMPEVCNGLDDNCNGSVDEGVVQACTVFGCTGVRICLPGGDGGFTSCMPANPLPETCNGRDDDCNGQVDDLPDLSCGLGPCRRVAAACVDGGAGTCTPGMPGPELCNGVDDDCNNTIDDGVTPLSCGVGACARSVPACLFDGGMAVCLPGMAMAEVCNNADDNCNGTRDEQPDGGPLTQVCYSGVATTRNVGVCRDGSRTCVGGSYSATCPGEVTPSAELCNTSDDDCDGVSDEELDGGPLRRACYSGLPATRNVGRCVDGSQVCSAGSYGATCPGEVLPTTEICNNVDDNCNGARDENPDGGAISRACYSGPGGTLGVGRCRGGTQLCTSGAFGVTCPGEVVPTTEVCGNSLDDNCNMLTDEACDGGACNPVGTWTIDGGPLQYQCCNFFGSYQVRVDINRFDINPATTVRPVPQQPGSTLTTTTAPACPSGSFTFTRVLTGACAETYTLTGTFTSSNRFVGTYTASFMGSQCTDPFLCGGADCLSQSWPIEVYR